MTSNNLEAIELLQKAEANFQDKRLNTTWVLINKAKRLLQADKVQEKPIDTWEDWKIHAPERCKGTYCPFHNPSDHPLKDAKKHIRGDKMMLVERICEHGVGHDDPDSVAYLYSKGEMWAGVHGCDGCCESKPTPPKPTKETKLNAIKERLQLMDSPRPEVLYLRDEVIRITNILAKEEY